jgi:tetratricopeptide (TPR) repeat protein
MRGKELLTLILIELIVLINNSLLVFGEFIDTISFISKGREKRKKCDEFLQRGIEAYFEKRYDLADHFYHIALTYYPDHSDVLFNKGVLYQHSGDIPKSIQYYEAALRSNPDDLRIRLNLGAMYQVTTNFSAAIENYK